MDMMSMADAVVVVYTFCFLLIGCCYNPPVDSCACFFLTNMFIFSKKALFTQLLTSFTQL